MIDFQNLFFYKKWNLKVSNLRRQNIQSFKINKHSSIILSF